MVPKLKTVIFLNTKLNFILGAVYLVKLRSKSQTLSIYTLKIRKSKIKSTKQNSHISVHLKNKN